MLYGERRDDKAHIACYKLGGRGGPGGKGAEKCKKGVWRREKQGCGEDKKRVHWGHCNYSHIWPCMYGYGHVSMVTAMYVWLQPCMYGYSHVCMAMYVWYSHVWLWPCMAMYVWLRPCMYGHVCMVQPCMVTAMYGHVCMVQPCMVTAMYGNVCMVMAMYVWLQPCMYGNSYVCMVTAMYVWL